MMILKLLINLIPALFVILTIYLTFYFEVIPKLLGHYRRTKKTEKKYAEEIEEIKHD